MVRPGEFSPNAGLGPNSALPGGGSRRNRGAMDYNGLLSQKRAEESRFRSGWDPIGSPTGLSRSTLGTSYLGGNNLMSAESSLLRLDSFSGGFGGSSYSGSSYGGSSYSGSNYGGSSSSQGGFLAAGGGMSTSNSNMPGNAGDPGAARRTMQENYRRDLQRQVEEDRARKRAEKEREQQETTGVISTIYRPTFLDAGPSNGRRRSVANVYGDDLAQQIEERRQKQERDRNNLLMYNQQQNGQSGFSFGDNSNNGGRRRPHVSETSYDRAQRSQTGTVQAELQQQIAEKKQRELERKQREAEEDAQLDARLAEQQRKIREELEREQQAREQKERSRLERQRVIEEQQLQAQRHAEERRRAAKDRRGGVERGPATEWTSWTDDRPAGSQQPAPPLEELWSRPEEPPPPPPVVERWSAAAGSPFGPGAAPPPPAVRALVRPRLSPPVPALTRRAASPGGDAAAGPFDIPCRRGTRPVPRRRSLHTARPNSHPPVAGHVRPGDRVQVGPL